MKTGPILIVDDDIDDREILVNTFRQSEVANEIVCFNNPIEAITFLQETHENPFLIISDINMPKMNGLMFRKAIIDDESLHRKRIPFIFLSTSNDGKMLDTAYKLSAHGFFQKTTDCTALKEIVAGIVFYWKQCCYSLTTDDRY